MFNIASVSTRIACWINTFLALLYTDKSYNVLLPYLSLYKKKADELQQILLLSVYLAYTLRSSVELDP